MPFNQMTNQEAEFELTSLLNLQVSSDASKSENVSAQPDHKKPPKDSATELLYLLRHQNIKGICAPTKVLSGRESSALETSAPTVS